MSTAQEAPALIQYACERCKTRFVLPPSRRQLGFGRRLKAAGMALSRTVRYHEGLGATYDGARRQLLAKMDDDAYQSFVQSFKFCHECRQFVCGECWSASRKTCLGCFAKAAGTVRPRPPYAPEGPSIPRPVLAAGAALAAAAVTTGAVRADRGKPASGKASAGMGAAATAAAATAASGRGHHLRTDATLLVMGAAVILLVVEMFVILPGLGHTGSSPSMNDIGVLGSPTASPTDAPTASPTASPTATPTLAPTPSPTDSPSPSPAPTAPPVRITPKPVPPPKATPYPTPVITCNKNAVTDGGTVTCTWRNPSSPRQALDWQLNSASYGSSYPSQSFTIQLADGPYQCARLRVEHGGVWTELSNQFCFDVS
jgi:hypothetical protein